MSPEMRPFKNSNLFSNHYLEKLLPESPEWRETSPAEAFQAIKELYERKARVLENYNESQLEENFIRPALRILGHHFEGGCGPMLQQMILVTMRCGMNRICRFDYPGVASIY